MLLDVLALFALVHHVNVAKEIENKRQLDKNKLSFYLFT
jgi:hypothetical protein